MSPTMCKCGRPTSGAILCVRCQKTLAVALVNVAAYYDDLTTVSTKQVRYGSSTAGKGSVGKTQPLVADARFLEVTGDGTQVRWNAWATVVAWARTVMEEQPPLHEPACVSCLHISCAAVRRRRWPRNTIRSMVAYFDRQFRWIVAERWAEDFLDEMLETERQLRRMIDRPADRWYAGRCSASNPADPEGSECPADLYAKADNGTIECSVCGSQHDVAARRDFLLEEAKDYLVTATEAAQALLAWTDYDGSETKLVDRIRKWRDRDKLEVQEVTSLAGRDRHLYRLGDVQELLVEAARDTQATRLITG